MNMAYAGKEIKIWFTDFWPDFQPEKSLYYRILKIHYHVTISDEEPDILFFSVFGDKNKQYHCKRVLVIGEPYDLMQYDYDYCIGHHYELGGQKNGLRWNMFAPRLPYLNFLRLGGSVFWAKPEKAERKFCNFIYSNASNGSGALLCQDFCRMLSEYRSVDCPGKVLNNMDSSCISPERGHWTKVKMEFIKNYKFTIAFENESIPGYTTEKLWQPLRVGSIPIYWGNSRISDEVNSRAIINCHDYDCDFEAVLRRIEEVDRDQELYLHMLKTMPLKRGYRYGYGDLRRFLHYIVRE